MTLYPPHNFFQYSTPTAHETLALNYFNKWISAPERHRIRMTAHGARSMYGPGFAPQFRFGCNSQIPHLHPFRQHRIQQTRFASNLSVSVRTASSYRSPDIFLTAVNSQGPCGTMGDDPSSSSANKHYLTVSISWPSMKSLTIAFLLEVDSLSRLVDFQHSICSTTYLVRNFRLQHS